MWYFWSSLPSGAPVGGRAARLRLLRDEVCYQRLSYPTQKLAGRVFAYVNTEFRRIDIWRSVHHWSPSRRVLLSIDSLGGAACCCCCCCWCCRAGHWRMRWSRLIRAVADRCNQLRRDTSAVTGDFYTATASQWYNASVTEALPSTSDLIPWNTVSAKVAFLSSKNTGVAPSS